ncbi:thioredoxin fold domain-containing protein [Flammeovirga yaeyamensis]|uniref:Thioredoxin fold domain-containing protein n=1 Tax=Flammeovirga yaeyamensis TaxID=367791 RepID=A0AAX1N9V2_9BACT|nr:thioredoxin fold domain-containing protein [Flammeovirga yaeyamensis]MBB3699360.1 thioredoxin-related protein [Flammeovirga yaeyamensis]NMF35380.1 thioredoxin fold domain-containing protein [Flammeovirga yaeyamensis]QWG04240.1 thioredoxin fold domain-containing protein [Flammeovirga yaeyamensis]
MKRIFSLFSMLLISIASFAQGVEFFEGTFAEAKAEAKKQNKYIFLDAYTTWCGPCKMLKKKVFPEKIVGDVMNEHFINIAIDMEKGEGIELAKTYQVKAYPTLLFFDADGNEIDRLVGALPAEEFVEAIKETLKPENQLVTLKANVYDVKTPSKEDLSKYLNKVYGAYKTDDVMLGKFLALVTDGDLKVKENTDLLIKASYVSGIESGLLPYFDKIDAEEKAIEGAKNNLAYNTLRNAVRANVSEEEFNTKVELVKKEIPESTSIIAQSEAQFYMKKKDYAKANMAVDQLAASMSDEKRVSSVLNSFAWKYYEANVEAKHMKKALTWINRSVMIDANYANVDTQAHVYKALGKTEKAIEAAQKSIELGKAAGQDVSSTEELLKELSKNN